MNLRAFIRWWERGVFGALFVSMALLGIGRLEFAPNQSLSAWSASRTTFFFWIILRVLLLIQRGESTPSATHWRRLAPLCAFFVVVTVSLLPDFHAAGDYRYFAFACAHAVMVFDMFSAPKRRKWLPLLLGVFPVFLAVRGVLHDPWVLTGDLTHRFGFPLDHANTAGYLFAMSMPVCLLVATVGKIRWRAIAWLSFAAQALALVLTFSRGAWLGCGAAMLSMSLTSKKWQYWIATIVASAAIAGAVPTVRERIVETITSPQADPSIGDRLEVLHHAFQVGLQNPLLGVGYGRGRLKEALRDNLPDGAEYSPVAHTHNLYMELFAETGLLGLGAFVWLLWHTLHALWRSTSGGSIPDRTCTAIASSLCAAIVAGLGDIPFFHHETRIFFFSLLAWACLEAEARLGANAAPR